jgi:hypothetical protein
VRGRDDGGGGQRGGGRRQGEAKVHERRKVRRDVAEAESAICPAV